MTLLFDLKQEVSVLDEDDPEATVVSFVNQIMRAALEETREPIFTSSRWKNDLRNPLSDRTGVLHEVPVPSKIKMPAGQRDLAYQDHGRISISPSGRMPQDGPVSISRWKGQPIDVPCGDDPDRERREHQPFVLLARKQIRFFSLLGLTAAAERKNPRN